MLPCSNMPAKRDGYGMRDFSASPFEHAGLESSSPCDILAEPTSFQVFQVVKSRQACIICFRAAFSRKVMITSAGVMNFSLLPGPCFKLCPVSTAGCRAESQQSRQWHREQSLTTRSVDTIHRPPCNNVLWPLPHACVLCEVANLHASRGG